MSNMLLTTVAIASLQVSSPAFTNNGNIPSKYTCEGQNTSPELNIKNLPVQTVSLAIVVEDPDAPTGIVTHWLAWNIDPAETIAENSNAGMQGKNTKGNNEYMGPCPPLGVHHYHFNVYALDNKLALLAGSSKEQLIDAIKGHILASGELIGLYERRNRC